MELARQVFAVLAASSAMIGIPILLYCRRHKQIQNKMVMEGKLEAPSR
jgi:hypothetical protein